MTRSSLGLSQTERTISNQNKPYHLKQHPKTSSFFSFYSPKFSIYLLIACALLFILFQIRSLHIPSSPLPSWGFLNQWQKVIINTTPSTSTFNNDQDNFTKAMAKKLRESVTFLPLKDLRYSSKAQQGHTWFMSSMYDTHEEVEVQYQRFPSSASKGEGDEFDRHTNIIPTRSTINIQQCDKTSWSGMKHDGDLCPYFDDDKIGCNETYFSEWARGERIRKKE